MSLYLLTMLSKFIHTASSAASQNITLVDLINNLHCRQNSFCSSHSVRVKQPFSEMTRVINMLSCDHVIAESVSTTLIKRNYCLFNSPTIGRLLAKTNLYFLKTSAVSLMNLIIKKANQTQLDTTFHCWSLIEKWYWSLVDITGIPALMILNAFPLLIRVAAGL